ncbi:hypothetical protein PFISCL1PPCAC_27243 [Pristionchus fissidentatus]|uniref:Ig-like domain-containing protein n=1 Tax=Pristionchus fissidentatus TaxID=1538716 RepID=A0AAV5WXS8_9BILA|nr:hypothetical protein PFISCL1PPCAC_27243 [Pristionchus fissidentatus]
MQLDGTVVITVDIKEAVNKHTVYQCAIVYDDGFTSKPLVASWEIHFPLHEMSPFITQPPKLYTQRIREKGTSNIAVYMKVAFASGLETQVVWLDPRMKVIEKSELVNITVAKNGENSIAQLTLSQIRPAQSGKYICRLINGYGSMDVQFGIAPAPKFIDDFRGTHLHGDEPCTHYPGNEGKTEKVKDNKTEPLPLPEECFLIEMDRHRVKEMANNMMEFKRKRVAQQTSKLEAQQKKKNDRAEKGKRKTNVVPSDSDSDDDQTNNKTTSCA